MNVVVIPARLESSRFPKKMLCDTGGKPLIRRVYDQCAEVFDDVYVATDSKEIADVVPNAIMTPKEARNGTERCAYALNQLPNYVDTVINVQGDMVDVPTDCLLDLVDQLWHNPVATVYTDMPEHMQNDPNTVKMVHSDKRALWFGRGLTGYGSWHLGIYGYRKDWLPQYLDWGPCQEEEVESLEQLRWLKKSHCRMGITYTSQQCAEINTPEDLEKWQKTL